MKHPHNFGLTPNFSAIPTELHEGRWCVWVAKPKANGKVDKIPHNGIKFIRTTEPDTWLTFDQAKKVYEGGQYNGVGRLAEKVGLAFIDIDGSKQLPEDVKELGATYCEKSPSGKGLRLVYKVDDIPSRDLKEPFEVYVGNSPRFLTITGNAVKPVDIASKNGQLKKLVEAYVSAPVVDDDPFAGIIKPDFSDDDIQGFLSQIDPDAGHDTWLTVMMALHHHYDGDAKGMEVLDTWSQPSIDYNRREIKQRYDSFTGSSSTPITAASLKKMAKESTLTSLDNLGDDPVVEVTAHRFSYVEDFIADFSAPNWVIKGIVEHDSLGMIYGASGAGKSYLALDIAASVATGTVFHDHKTEQGDVIYMAGEGARGIKARLLAWFKDRGVAPNRNLLITNRITDFSNAEDLKATVAELKSIGVTAPKLIVIDTLARASGGLDENSTQDMNIFIKACDGLRKAFNGATILPIHHTGKSDKSAARGSSVLRAAMDIEIQVDGLDNGISVTSTKMKDGDPFDTMGLAFRRVDLDRVDEDGEQVHSAVLYRDQEKLDTDTSGGKLSPTGKAVVAAFKTVWETGKGRVNTPPELVVNWGMDAPAEGLWLSDVRAYFDRSQPDAKESTLRSRWKRGVDDATEKEALALLDEVLIELT